MYFSRGETMRNGLLTLGLTGLLLGGCATGVAHPARQTHGTFGRASRETVCSCEVVMEPNLSQALHLINGDTTNQKIQQGRLVQKLLDEGKDTNQVIDHLYRVCFSRPPTEEELQRVAAAVQASENKPQALEDVFWALLNAKEFMFNH